VGTDDHWHADVGSTGLLNLSVLLGIPVQRPSRGGKDRRFGVPILGPVLTRSRGFGRERLGLRVQVTGRQVGVHAFQDAGRVWRKCAAVDAGADRCRVQAVR
jgi:hypothetical protein